ncbi:hypothetical protein FACS189446_8950 [Bacteroidia bacterium]|nr:hypothetical protein FACS189446_8950 [Bacteroidia bacterium]
MIREDIEIRQTKDSITIKSYSNFMTFDRKGTKIYFSAKLSTNMLDDIESSKIVVVKECNFDKGLITLSPLSFFKIESFTDVLISLFEKYNL